MDYLAINKHAWDQRTKIHITSEFYNLKAFKQGQSSLNPIELDLVGEMSGKSLLHLQCHFGMDTLSWARAGAKVTGVDLSTVAIEQADKLAQELDIPAQFICSDVNLLSQQNKEKYDVVYTSYGVICWLQNLDKWAQTIVQHLKPDGRFCMVEFHPIIDLVQGYSYFHQTAADIEQESTYTENAGTDTQQIATWVHPLSDVLTALMNAGLRIEYFQEYNYSPYNCLDDMQEREPGKFIKMFNGNEMPLLFSIEAKLNSDKT